jgi:hypothetical protein
MVTNDQLHAPISFASRKQIFSNHSIGERMGLIAILDVVAKRIIPTEEYRNIYFSETIVR